MNLKDVKTIDLIKELEGRTGVVKISTAGTYSKYELKESFVRRRSEDGTRGRIKAEVVLVIQDLNQVDTLENKMAAPEPQPSEQLTNINSEWRRFEPVTKDEAKIKAFTELCQAKNITKKDLLLILSTIIQITVKRRVKAMEWLNFLNRILDEKQVDVLRLALKLNAPVHFYGTGLGKSIAVEALSAAGYNVSDPAELDGGVFGPCGVPDRTGVVCFNVKKGAPEFVPRLYDVLAAEKNEIVQWVNR